MIFMIYVHLEKEVDELIEEILNPVSLCLNVRVL